MNFLGIADILFLKPLEILFEVIFSLLYRFFHNAGCCIVGMSLIINILVLPLYLKADEMQSQVRRVEEKLEPMISHIKRNFSGDEQYMILQTYYRQNHYKPVYALRGCISLVLQIPFFIAAYRFLSSAEALQNSSLGLIQNLSAPDQLIHVFGISINILPLIMTTLNLISCAVYCKNSSIREKLQLYVMAVVFLVLLYQSPSGMVLYWTINNAFSLAKNGIMSLKNPKKVLVYLCSIVGAIPLMVLIVRKQQLYEIMGRRGHMMVAAVIIILQLPLLCHIMHIKSRSIAREQRDSIRHKSFLLGIITMTMLTGILIPSAVIASSPAEFINVTAAENPVKYIVYSGILAAGVFCIWFLIFYILMDKNIKNMMILGIWMICGVSILDYMFFGQEYGNLSPILAYDRVMDPSNQKELINLIVCICVSALLILVFRKKEYVEVIYYTTITALLIMSTLNIAKIYNAADQTVDELKNTKSSEFKIPLSTRGKNVVVLMEDRAISGYLPYIFQEKPELMNQFEGFTYYPNTISYGRGTHTGSSSLYGGFEYNPENINKRSNELMVEKHNEALKVLPVFFSQHGYLVNVCDPSYAGYQCIPDLSIYENYPDIQAYNLDGHFTDNLDIYSPEEELKQIEWARNRNFFCYSIMRCAPIYFQPALYNWGHYNQLNASAGQTVKNMHQASGLSDTFVKTYSVIKSLPQITEIKNNSQNTFLMMANSTTHDAMLLQEPQYIPSLNVDNTDYDAAHTKRFEIGNRKLKMESTEQMMHYQCNMAAYLEIGKWLDYLRENDVYDNTRIIIVSDHGFPLRQLEDKIIDGIDIMQYNPVLLVKDFDSHEFKIDERFSANADTPAHALKDLFINPKNPFTGAPLNCWAEDFTEHFIVGDLFSDFLNSTSCQMDIENGYMIKSDFFSTNQIKTIQKPRIS